MMMDKENSRSGYIAIVGRPNVGKSTLLNRILGQKISITSRKPQTTRHKILGVKTCGDVQAIYIDTPGLHRERKEALNHYMNSQASSALRDVDLVIMVVEKDVWTDEDELVLDKVRQCRSPVIAVVNKVDLLQEQAQLLPLIDTLSKKFEFAEIVPTCARRGDNLDRLEKLIVERLPKGVHYFPEDQITDRSERFLASEMVREKIMRRLGDEVPYQITVEIEQFKHEDKLLRIRALILVERDGQKRIIIGHRGEQLKQIGRDARIDMERLFGVKVMLHLWVKVKTGWADNERSLRSLGYHES